MHDSRAAALPPRLLENSSLRFRVPLQHRQRPRGFGPRREKTPGPSAAISFSPEHQILPLAAFLSAAAWLLGFAAFGMIAKHAKAWARQKNSGRPGAGDAPMRPSTMVCNACPALLRGDGKSL